MLFSHVPHPCRIIRAPRGPTHAQVRAATRSTGGPVSRDLIDIHATQARGRTRRAGRDLRWRRAADPAGVHQTTSYARGRRSISRFVHIAPDGRTDRRKNARTPPSAPAPHRIASRAGRHSHHVARPLTFESLFARVRARRLSTVGGWLEPARAI